MAFSSDINASSPIEKYPYPTEFNVLDFVPKALCERNYNKWKKLMEDFIERRGLIGLIDGTAREEIANQDYYKAWKRSDNLVQGWILATLTEDTRLRMLDEKTAKDMWTKLASSSDSNANSPIEKYPYPMESNVLDFVPKLLSKENYDKWKKLMEDFIERRGLIGFIRGPAKEEIDNQDMAWQRSDNLVQGWILATLVDDVRLRVLGRKTAHEMWTRLTKIFEPAKAAEPLSLVPLSVSERRKIDDQKKERRKILTAAIKENISLTRYLSLHKATIKGDWEKIKETINQDPDAIKTPINQLSETALIVAIKSVRRNHFVRKLLEEMKPDDHVVDLVDSGGRTALHWAAYCGNIEGATMLVNNCLNLPNVLDEDGLTPLHYAARYGLRKMVLYLQELTSKDILLADNNAGFQYLHALTSGELYDMALTLLEEENDLAGKVLGSPGLAQKVLDIIVEQWCSIFPRENSLNFWRNLIYSGVPMKAEIIANCLHEGGGRDIESLADCCISVTRRLHLMFWGVVEKLVPHIKCIRENKLRHHHALQLFRFLCSEIAKSNFTRVQSIFKPVLLNAIRMGNSEIVEEIILSFPIALLFASQDDRNIFQEAILWRRERVFNLIYQMDIGFRFMAHRDKLLNNGLHLAALLGHEQQINLKASVPVAALQMQRELQWYKVVENFLKPTDKEQRNANGMTPAQVFSDTHQALVKESEQWMKDTATSCTIVAALIATMVFAAAITVPGGNNSDNGHPILSKHNAFLIFGISDGLALFSSITSVLMFLLILTSRYAEEDFLHTLPSRLVIGLITLFVSILSMMVAFGAILYLVFGDNKAWILIPIIASASIPATLFGTLQFPLLLDMIQSTYCRGIFVKQSDRVLL